MAYEVRVAGVTSTRTLRTAMTNYRSKRGNCYSFRRKVPLDLQAHFGRKEFVKALGTSDPIKADLLCREYAVVYDAIFANARQSAKATESVRAMAFTSRLSTSSTRSAAAVGRPHARK
jgi:hypothetical protein